MRTILSYAKRYKWQFMIGPAFKLIEAVFELLVPLVMTDIIDIGIPNGDVGFILKKGLLLVIFTVVGLSSTLVCQYSAAIAFAGIGADLRNALFRHINTFSGPEIDRFGANTLSTRLTNDVSRVQTGVAMLIRLAVRAPFITIGATVMAFTVNAKLAWIFVLTTVIVAIIVFAVMHFSLPGYSLLQKKLDGVSKITGENLAGARMIRAFSGKKRERARFDAANDDYTAVALRTARISALLTPLTYIALNGAIVAIVYCGGFAVDSAVLTQGELIALVNYMLQMLTALLVVANLFIVFSKAYTSAVRVGEVLDTESSIVSPEKEDAVTADLLAKKTDAPILVFDKVSFAYEGTSADAEMKNVLSGVSFTLDRGENLGIIGATGCGKSTLVSLIMRFYDCSEGEIRVGGYPVKKIALDALRSCIALVPQHATLLTGTVAENLRWGDPDLTEDQLWEALRIAQAEDFIKNKPDGLQEKVLQGASNFSGGQKQRLAIARAVAAGGDLLILDDASSALDYATDAALWEALMNHCPDMAKIIVSQRINSVKKADRILVLDPDTGRVAGIGTHEELLRSCGEYREIYESQQYDETAAGEVGR